MSSPSDPISRLKRARLAVDAVGLSAAVGLTAWALAPAPPPSFPIGAPNGRHAPATVGVAPFPLSVFDRDLWHVPPAPVVVKPPKQPDMPKLELIGIARQGGAFRALVADAADQEIRSVAEGDVFGVTSVLAVTSHTVRCEAHGVSFELSLGGEAP